jgi:hypothetical protein
MRRTIVALGISGVLLLAGCGQAATASPDISDAAVALQQVGFSTESTGSTATAAPARKVLRKNLRKNTLHGEVVVQTKKNGVRTVVVQRGSITAVTGDRVSVQSSDGFALTWTLGDKVRVVQDHKAVAASALKTGAAIGIAGTKEGGTSTARLIVLT